jgi:hypothetical protein
MTRLTNPVLPRAARLRMGLALRSSEGAVQGQGHVVRKGGEIARVTPIGVRLTNADSPPPLWGRVGEGGRAVGQMTASWLDP